MHRVIHNACRLFFAAATFTMVFLLTPRGWVDEPIEPRSRTIPVDRLEQSNTCLWCGPEHAISDDCRDRGDDDRLWLNPDDPRPDRGSSSCDDSSDSDPNT